MLKVADAVRACRNNLPSPSNDDFNPDSRNNARNSSYVSESGKFSFHRRLPQRDEAPICPMSRYRSRIHATAARAPINTSVGIGRRRRQVIAIGFSPSCET